MQKIRKTKINLALSGGRNFVVMTLDNDSDFSQNERDRILIN
jgi:hypothetical protein